MLGFRQLQAQISALDYRAFSAIARALERLEGYIDETRTRKDWPAMRASQEILEGWLDAINKKTANQAVLSSVQVGNLLRCQTVLRRFRERL